MKDFELKIRYDKELKDLWICDTSYNSVSYRVQDVRDMVLALQDYLAELKERLEEEEEK